MLNQSKIIIWFIPHPFHTTYNTHRCKDISQRLHDSMILFSSGVKQCCTVLLIRKNLDIASFHYKRSQFTVADGAAIHSTPCVKWILIKKSTDGFKTVALLFVPRRADAFFNDALSNKQLPQSNNFLSLYGLTRNPMFYSWRHCIIMPSNYTKALNKSQTNCQFQTFNQPSIHMCLFLINHIECIRQSHTKYLAALCSP